MLLFNHSTFLVGWGGGCLDVLGLGLNIYHTLTELLYKMNNLRLLVSAGTCFLNDTWYIEPPNFNRSVKYFSFPHPRTGK